MTYTRLEIVKIVCDECDREEEIQTNDEYENPIESENELFTELQEQGWVYDEEEDQHYCPECAKEMKKHEVQSNEESQA